MTEIPRLDWASMGISKDKPMLFACVPVNGYPRAAVIGGSTQYACDGCGGMTWMSPATRLSYLDAQRQGYAPFRLCVKCTATKGDPDEVSALIPDAHALLAAGPNTPDIPIVHLEKK